MNALGRFVASSDSSGINFNQHPPSGTLSVFSDFLNSSPLRGIAREPSPLPEPPLSQFRPRRNREDDVFGTPSVFPTTPQTAKRRKVHAKNVCEIYGLAEGTLDEFAAVRYFLFISSSNCTC